MSQAANLPETSEEVANYLSEDIAYKLKLIISRAVGFMRHSNRTILSCSDINRALSWSACQPLFGYECDPNRVVGITYSEAASVHVFNETVLDLSCYHGARDKFRDLLDEETLVEAVPKLFVRDSELVPISSREDGNDHT